MFAEYMNCLQNTFASDENQMKNWDELKYKIRLYTLL